MPKSPIDLFFSIGNRLEPKAQQQFAYYLTWVIFLTFLGMAITYFTTFWKSSQIIYIGWGILMLVFSYFNYMNLNQMRNALIIMNSPQKVENVESKEEMIRDFEK